MDTEKCPNSECEILVFRPTMKEFQHFSRYIQYVESQGAHKAGICKIIPPKEWLDQMNTQDYSKTDNLVIGTPIEQTFVSSGSKTNAGVYEVRNLKKYSQSVSEFRAMALGNRYKTPPYDNYDDLEKKYWKSICYIPPIYGADVNGSLFGEEIDCWNIAKLDSVLDLIGMDNDIEIAGVTSPYLYFGMWRATFPWHVEDMDLYSINYIHHGQPKTWFAISPQDGKRFEMFASSMFPSQSNACSAWLRHKTSMINPNLVRNHGIKVRKIVHKAGEIVVTFPFGYHSGFNHGFNIAESTNFALPRWVKYGRDALRCFCTDDMVQINMDLFKILNVPTTKNKNYYNEIPRTPDFDAEFVHWRKQFQIANFADDGFCKINEIYTKKGIDPNAYFNQFLKCDSENTTDEGFKFATGDTVFVKRGQVCAGGTVVARHREIQYSVVIAESQKRQTVDPIDVMTFDYRTSDVPSVGDNFQVWHSETQAALDVTFKGLIQHELYYIHYEDGTEGLANTDNLVADER